MITLSYNLDSRTWAGADQRNITSISLKLRDRVTIAVKFFQNGSHISLSAQATGKLGLKKKGVFQGGYIASLQSWTKQGSPTIYSFDLNLNTSEATALFAGGKANTPSVNLVLEISIEQSPEILSSALLSVILENDLNQGNEGPMSQANPDYPLAADVLTKSGNLSGIVDPASARINLATYSQAQVDNNVAAHATRTDNPHATTKSQVGLGNVPNVDATSRSTHTGTQLASSISDFTTAAADASPIQSVAGKTGVVTLAPSDVGLGNVNNTNDSNKPVSTAQQTALDGKANTSHTHTISNVTGLQTALDGKQASGSYATLDGTGKVPSSQLPSFVDDVLEYATLSAFPATGESGKIYTDISNGKIYRWGGSVYVEISAAPGSTDAVPEGSGNLYYTAARALAAVTWATLTGIPSWIGAATTYGKSLLSGADASAVKTLLSLTKTDVGLDNVPNTDATTRANHTGTQTASTISDFNTTAATAAPVQSVAGRTGAVTLAKADVGLGSVDNTSDSVKPISTATQTALDLKANQSSLDTTNSAVALKRNIYSGTTAPSNGSPYASGDFYFNTSNGLFYGPYAAGAWPTATSLVGPANSIAIGTISTNAGTAATATITGTAPSQTLNLGLSSPQIAIGTITTGAAGSSASASVDNTDPKNPILALTIPRGNAGTGATISKQSANFTATSGNRFVTSGTITVTDPASPTTGDIYEVIVQSGTTTIGGAAFSAGSLEIVRYYNGTAWATLTPNSAIDARVTTMSTQLALRPIFFPLTSTVSTGGAITVGYNYASIGFNASPTAGTSGGYVASSNVPSISNSGTVQAFSGQGPALDFSVAHQLSFDLYINTAAAQDNVIRIGLGQNTIAATGILGTLGGGGYQLKIVKSGSAYAVYLLACTNSFGTYQTITAASNASPIVITGSGHSLSNGDSVEITGVVGNTAANGVWIVANKTTTTFELTGSTGNGTWTSGGTYCKISPTSFSILPNAFNRFVLVSSGTGTVTAYLGSTANTASLSITGGNAGKNTSQTYQFHAGIQSITAPTAFSIFTVSSPAILLYQ